jgi:hypothetical protein
MAITTVNVIGTVYLPNGAPAANVRMRWRLTEAGVVDDAGASQRVGGVFEASADASGAVDFNVIPNDTITPAGTFYHVTFETDKGEKWTEELQPASAPSPVNIGAIPAPA